MANKNIVETYCEMRLAEDGLSPTRSIADICEKTGRRFSSVYVTQWRSGQKNIPNDVLRFLVAKVLPYVDRLQEDVETRIARLSPPALVEGRYRGTKTARER